MTNTAVKKKNLNAENTESDSKSIQNILQSAASAMIDEQMQYGQQLPA